MTCVPRGWYAPAMSRVLFKWTREGLIAANTGTPFTVGGLEALCSSHRSDKKDDAPRAFACSAEAIQKVRELRSNRLEAYKQCPGDIVEHTRAEKEMGKDYTNRLLLELLQNADDAAAEKPIGYKGLGFKAVLDISDHVRIRSGHLRVCFDLEESRQALLTAGLPNRDEVPVLRLPFWDDRDLGIPEAEGTYDTIIFLPWKVEDGRKDLFAGEWKTICGDPTILLFLNALEEVVWQPPEGDPTVWQCDRRTEAFQLSMRRGTDDPQCSCWRILRDPSGSTTNAAAAPVDSNGRPLPYRYDKVRVFFPTDENSPLPLVLHGEFDLEQNRKRVRPSGSRAEIVQSLAGCVRLVLCLVQDDGTFLDMLQPREGLAGLDQEIWEAIKANVQDMPLPQSKVRIDEVRLRPSSCSMNGWREFKELLERYRPGGLTGLQLLPPGVDNDRREKVVLTFNPDARLNIERLRALPVFPVEGHDQPVAAALCHLFFPPDDNQPRPTPEGIRIRFLRKDFAEACKADPAVQVLLTDLGVCEFTSYGIANALAQQRFEGVSQQALWDYLLVVIAPFLQDSDEVMDWKDKAREGLTSCIDVPCRDGCWRPAIEVYAGHEWANDDFLDRAYGSRPDRTFLAPPPPEETARKTFERVARWLGVGWAPKVLPVVNYQDKRETKEGILWRVGFPLSQPPARWKEHCNELNKDGQDFHRTARLRQDWSLDGDEEVLSLSGAFASIVREWNSYESYLQAVIYRSSNMRADYDNEKVWSAPSYLAHLFSHVAWIPVEGSETPVAACDVFLEGSPVHQALAGWVLAPAVKAIGDAARGLGIRESWSALTKDDWGRWLTRAAQSAATQAPEVRKRIRALYEETLARSSMDGTRGLRWDGPVWCIEKRLDNTEVWHLEKSPQNILFVDRPDLARLRLGGARTFPVELGWIRNKQKVANIFRIGPLSERLQGTVTFANGVIDENLVEKIRDRLQNRIKCLAACLRVKGKDAEAAKQKWDELGFRIGRELHVDFVLDSQPLDTQARPTFFQPKSERECPILWFDIGDNFTDQGQPRDIVWEEVAAALCYTAGLALEDGTVFAALLSCGEDSLKRKLLNLGVIEEEIQSALPKPRTPPVSTAPTAVQQAQPTAASLVTPESSSGGHPPTSAGGNGGGHGGGGGGGENRAHRALKDRLWEHPELIEAGMQQYRREPELASHFRPDLILKDAQGKYVAVEVETEFPDESDYGVWQAVAYKHVAAAEFNQQCDHVRGVLVAPQIPNSIKEKCRQLGVEPVEVGREILTD